MLIALAAWGTLNNRRAVSLLVRLVTGDDRCEAPDLPPDLGENSKLGSSSFPSFPWENSSLKIGVEPN
ncbi:hypothetical protein TNCV_3630891 [Trichonephila clavipes]|nr:hypothetical protein TNCV_3630891 [Trichonephila clavipes]